MDLAWIDNLPHLLCYFCRMSTIVPVSVFVYGKKAMNRLKTLITKCFIKDWLVSL